MMMMMTWSPIGKNDPVLVEVHVDEMYTTY